MAPPRAPPSGAPPSWAPPPRAPSGRTPPRRAPPGRAPLQRTPSRFSDSPLGVRGDLLAGQAKAFFSDVDWRQTGLLALLFVAIWLLWDFPVLYPLKLLVVFFHESSHGITAYLTGGKVLHMEVSPAEGGVCYTQGGSRFLTLSAGYLGSLAWGGLILTLASRTRYDRHIAIVLGLATLGISVIFVRPLLGFGSFFTLAAGAALTASGYYLPEWLNDVLLRVIGLTSCLYATLDIKSDIIDRSSIRSDARMLAEYTGIPTLFWGLLWISIAFCASCFMVLLACKPREERGDPNWHLPPSLDLPLYHRPGMEPACP